MFDRLRMIFDDFKKNFFFFEKHQKSIKSDVSDANGPRKRDFHEEAMPIDTGETDFRSTVTHFMILFAIHIILCHNTITPSCLS